jgi:hypothetical protein
MKSKRESIGCRIGSGSAIGQAAKANVLSNLTGANRSNHGNTSTVFTQLASNESFAPMAFVYDEDHSAYEEPKLTKWLRARKPENPYQPNLNLRCSLELVEGGLQELRYEKAA